MSSTFNILEFDIQFLEIRHLAVRNSTINIFQFHTQLSKIQLQSSSNYVTLAQIDARICNFAVMTSERSAEMNEVNNIKNSIREYSHHV